MLNSLIRHSYAQALIFDPRHLSANHYNRNTNHLTHSVLHHPLLAVLLRKYKIYSLSGGRERESFRFSEWFSQYRYHRRWSRRAPLLYYGSNGKGGLSDGWRPGVGTDIHRGSAGTESKGQSNFPELPISTVFPVELDVCTYIYMYQLWTNN